MISYFFPFLKLGPILHDLTLQPVINYFLILNEWVFFLDS